MSWGCHDMCAAWIVDRDGDEEEDEDDDDDDDEDFNGEEGVSVPHINPYQDMI